MIELKIWLNKDQWENTDKLILDFKNTGEVLCLSDVEVDAETNRAGYSIIFKDAWSVFHFGCEKTIRECQALVSKNIEGLITKINKDADTLQP